MGNGLKVLVSFTSNGRKVTPLLYESNMPTTGYSPQRQVNFKIVLVTELKNNREQEPSDRLQKVD
jgi:hypothetical protein